MNKYAILDLFGLLLTGFVTDKITSLSVLLFRLIFFSFEYVALILVFQHCLFTLKFPQ